jgi:hypothetical protein
MTDVPSAAAWVRSVREAASVIAGPGWTDDAGRAWDQFAAQPNIVVTLYGPQNAGKSTLLKRLLVDSGVPVPPWLTISGRNETFEVGEVVSGELAFIDTPGIAAGIEGHEEIAGGALTRTDALLIAWPPVVASAAGEHLASVIGGGFYGQEHGGHFPPGALLVVIAKADELHPNVEDDVEGYRDVCALKQGELRAMLTILIPHASLPGIHVISADPFETVGRQRQPAAEAYDAGRAWDGIEELRAALDGLRARRGELRTAAEIRYWSWIAGQVLVAAMAQQEELAVSIRDSEDAAHRLRGLADDLRAVRNAAERDLIAQVSAEVRSAADSSLGDMETARTMVELRLDNVCTGWAARYAAQVDQLLRDADLGLPGFGLPARPAGSAYRDPVTGLLDRQPGAHSRSGESQSLSGLMRGLSEQATEVTQALLELRLRAPLDKVSEELDKLEKARGDADGVAKVLKAARSFSSETEATRARSLVHRFQAAGKILPSVTEMGMIVKAELDGRRLEQYERARREQLRADIDATSKEITAAVMNGLPGEPGLSSRIEAVLAQLDTRNQAGQQAVAAAEERRAELAATQNRLAELIRARH